MAGGEANRIIQGLRKQFESQAFSASTLGLVVNGLVITGLPRCVFAREHRRRAVTEDVERD